MTNPTYLRQRLIRRYEKIENLISFTDSDYPIGYKKALVDILRLLDRIEREENQ